jgi:predicted kinase
MSKVAFIMVGVSGSGKSTIQRKLMGELSSIDQYFCSTFSLDEARIRFIHETKPGQWWSDLDSEADIYRMAYQHANDNKKEFDIFVHQEWMATLATNGAIFIDNTNLTRKSRARWISDARSKGFKIVCVQVMTPLDTVLARQSSRTDKSVPLDTVRDMFMRQQEAQLGTECDVLINVDGTKPVPREVLDTVHKLVS